MGSMMTLATPLDYLDLGNDYLQNGKIQLPNGSHKSTANGLKDTTSEVTLKSTSIEPAYGKRLIAQTVDDIASSEPNRVWATIPLGSEISDGFRDVTVRQLANAVDATAWWLENKIGRSERFEVIAYIGQSDVRYAIMFFAAVKCGYVFMVPSIRNAEAGHLHVLENASCSKLFHSIEFTSTAGKLRLKKPELETFELAPLHALLDAPPKAFPYTKQWSTSWKEPVIIAHSSGSTGFPKQITITNGVFSVYDSLRFIPKVPGRRNQDNAMFNFPGGGRFYNPYPPFHLAGLFAMTYVPLFYTCTVLMGPSEKPPNGQMLSDMLKAVKVRAAWCPPTVIEQLLEIPGGFEQAAGLDFIMYTGGPLARAAGDKLSQVTDICQLYGSTESGTQVTLVPERETWQWFEWHPHLENEMVPMGDGTFEMVIHRNPNLLFLRQIYHTFPELETYRTNDLFVQHPQKPNLWRFHGRRDDVIVLANGEKFNPVIMEGVITGDPLVRGALIVGMARAQASLIVEPVQGHGLSDSEFIEQIWPTVQKANLEGPGHGRIYPSKVIVASSDKPFIRAGKGTIIRSQNIRQFETEIETLYEKQRGTQRGIPKLQLPISEQAVHDFVEGVVSTMFNGRGKIPDDVDFFNAGMDSLQTTEFAAQLKSWITTNEKAAGLVKVNPKVIYDYSSTGKLVAYLHSALNQTSGINQTQALANRNERMSEIIEKYSKSLVNRTTVILTGSTGSLGTHVLKALLHDPRVLTIFCLNRSSDAEDRQRETLSEHGEPDLLTRLTLKTRFFKADFSKPKFGLSKNDFTTLLSTCDVIIHNAWAVNFNQRLKSFEAVHIQGVRNFADFCLASERQPHLAFVSSVSTVQNWSVVNGTSKPVPERIVYDPAVALEMGYGEAKYVSERILAAASDAGVHASILRVGQIGGPLSTTAGDWNKTEWFPTLLKTSKMLGIVPDSLGTIDWIPIDILAEIIRDIVHELHGNDKSQTFNLVNPHKAEWSQLLPVVVDRWKITPVPFSDWVAKLIELEGTGKADINAIPALKVLEFFIGMEADLGKSGNRSLEFVTENGRRVSKAMADLRPIDAAAMGTWLDQWGF